MFFAMPATWRDRTPEQKMEAFLREPDWLDGSFGSDCRVLDWSVSLVVNSALLPWMMFFVATWNKAELKMASHRPGAGIAGRSGEFVDIGNYNYSIVWRFLCSAIRDNTTDGDYLRSALDTIVSKWPGVSPTCVLKRNCVAQGDILEAALGVWHDMSLETWATHLPTLDEDDLREAVRSFYDGLSSLCACVHRLTDKVPIFHSPSTRPNSNDAYVAMNICAHVWSIPTPRNAKASWKRGFRLDEYRQRALVTFI